jgi:signal transduction histidine kinase/CheY-like chemotaxis protein
LSDRDRDDHLALLRQQTILAKFGELALKSDDLDAILTEACRLVGEALGTDLAKIVELQEDGHTLLVRTGVGWKPGVVGTVTIKVEDDTSEGMALKTGEPMISPDIAKETRFRYPPFLVEHGVRAVANVVIIGGKDRPPFGILQVDSREPRQFIDEDTVFLRSYANLVAAAVDRLRVIGEMREGQERIRLAPEARVAERTRELVEANDKLRTEAEERRRIEEDLRQSHKMEAVGQLTGGLAHDFNNLLAGISGSLEMMRMRMAQGRMTELGRYIEAALSSVGRAAALTHRLLAFSRRQTLDPKAIRVDGLVGSMEDLFRRTVGPSVQIETTLASGLWPVRCDPNQLENALLNLVINACDAMPDGGHLVIETACVTVDEKAAASSDGPLRKVPDGEYVALSVTDTEMGMSPTTMTRVFEPFFTTKPLGQGTGLGLSMIYGFVQQSGGYIHLRSEVGQGTTVTIYLPRHLGAVDGEAEIDTMAGLPSKGSAVVLVVEDELPIRMVIADVLSDLGYTVLEAGDGRSGLKVLEAGTLVDLLITDVGLPGGTNGRQLADAARQQRPDLKVLFITGYAESAAVRNGLVEQGMQVMTKPFALEALAAKIEGILGH